MALKKRFDTGMGLVAENAYHRIASVRNEGATIVVDVDVFLDRNSYIAKKNPLRGHQFEFPNALKTSTGLLMEIYNLLKSNIFFAGAEDVIEEQVLISLPGTTIGTTLLVDGKVADGYSDGYDGHTYATSLNGITVSGKILLENYVLDGIITDADLMNIVRNLDGTIRRAHIVSANLAVGNVKQVIL